MDSALIVGLGVAVLSGIPSIAAIRQTAKDRKDRTQLESRKLNSEETTLAWQQMKDSLAQAQSDVKDGRQEIQALRAELSQVREKEDQCEERSDRLEEENRQCSRRIGALERELRSLRSNGNPTDGGPTSDGT